MTTIQVFEGNGIDPATLVAHGVEYSVSGVRHLQYANLPGGVMRLDLVFDRQDRDDHLCINLTYKRDSFLQLTCYRVDGTQFTVRGRYQSMDGGDSTLSLYFRGFSVA